MASNEGDGIPENFTPDKAKGNKDYYFVIFYK